MKRRVQVYYPDERRRPAPIRKIAAIATGSILFAASFPNPLFSDGLAFLAYFAFIPVFWITRNSDPGPSAAWGALYGIGAYGLFNYWLTAFHPLAGLIVGGIYAAYFALLFPLLTLSYRLFPERGFIVQWLLWLAYEYLRTLGFLGYPYGISGYTQWNIPLLIQIADIAGIWSVSGLVIFPSAYLAAAMRGGVNGAIHFLRHRPLPAVTWAIFVVGSLAYGVVGQVDYSAAPTKRIALIQNNSDPWRGGIEAYRENFMNLRDLSDAALSAVEKVDLVVWPETAFVPRIYWHSTYRDDPESYALVKSLLEYLVTTDVPFVIGNDDARKEPNEFGVMDRVDYNAALLFDRGVERGIYRKMRLVPFTEHFPYRKQLPWVYDALKAADTHFWKPGNAPTVLEASGFRFSTPICFEDSFGYLSRRFVQAGAEMIVNVTNDAWARSLSAQKQHAGMAIFRAVENRRSVVRAAASGQTCAIDPNGRIIAMAAPFSRVQLSVSVPVYSGRTSLYTRFGDFLGIVFVAAAGTALILGIGCRTSHRRPMDRSNCEYSR